MTARWTRWACAAVIGLVASAAVGETPRELLVQAAFFDKTKGDALAHVKQAQVNSAAALARNADDREAWLIQATSLGYRAKLTGDRGDALAARHQFETLTARDPRNPEAAVGLGAWHIGIINKFGRLVGRAVLGAQKEVGLAALDRSVTLGGNRAMFLGLNGLLRLQLDPDDPRGRQLTEAAAKGSTPTVIDRQLQRAASEVLVPLHAGDDKAVRRLAARLLPLGLVE